MHKTNISSSASSIYTYTGSAGIHQPITFKRPTGTCPKHGEVSGEFFCAAYRDGKQTSTTGPICPECYVDWIAANVTPVSPLPSPSEDPRP